ncbi:hypothetical protein Fmac_004477 [Flemingia macrophylla]|uniref:Protein kinase domain-containing protein n=1 Tax=Flemingia macrophylla TaxID=520843 RepID=A0ABD1N506_9FABA
MEIGKLTSLQNLSLAGNNFSGPIPDFISGMTSIQSLDLSLNSFSGQLPASLTKLTNLVLLNLSHNGFTGEIPKGVELIFSLEKLDLQGNMFDGFVPSGPLKGDSSVLSELYLSGNNLSGPVSIITSTTLHALNLSWNEFIGELLLLTGSCVVLDLSNNKLEGNLTRMMKWENIEFLDLSRNHLTGSIPEITPQFLRLDYLNLSNNFLSRSLPRVLTQYTKLKMLDVSSNQLDGKFLVDLLTMPTLQELHLENNMISGNINLSSFSLRPSDIQILELSYNQFNGYFPVEFGSLTGLKMLNVVGNNFSGSLPTTIANMSSLYSLDISENHFTGPLPINMPKELKIFNASNNDLSGLVPENLRKFPTSFFYPGNDRMNFPNGPFRSTNKPNENNRKPIVKVITIVSCVVVVLFVLVLLAVLFIYYIRISRSPSEYATAKYMSEYTEPQTTGPGYEKHSGGAMVVSAEDPVTSQKGSSTEIISLDENRAALMGFSLSKKSHFSSPGSSDSVFVGNHASLYVRSPDKLIGELYFLDDAMTLTPEELFNAPAEVLGKSCHGTSYKATLENDFSLRVKWLREGLEKQRKEFSKVAKIFANIKHPNVVGLRGYYWGPTQHEKLILSDYISPGSLASFLYDQPGREGPPLTWALRLKLAVDVARGLNYLHFDRVVPHGNLKATNMLLDTGDLNACVSDYCLHKLVTQAGTFEQILDVGISGYRAPELVASKKPMPSFR